MTYLSLLLKLYLHVPAMKCFFGEPKNKHFSPKERLLVNDQYHILFE